MKKVDKSIQRTLMSWSEGRGGGPDPPLENCVVILIYVIGFLRNTVNTSTDPL